MGGVVEEAFGLEVEGTSYYDIGRNNLFTCPQARLKSLHEVVVRNRLEQLRKRQRDEALQAQEELLEGVANVASKGKFRPPVIEAGVGQQSVEKIVEPYERGMSPGLVDITRLTHEERHVDIVLELDDRVSLVSNIDMCHRTKPIL